MSLTHRNSAHEKDLGWVVADGRRNDTCTRACMRFQNGFRTSLHEGIQEHLLYHMQQYNSTTTTLYTAVLIVVCTLLLLLLCCISIVYYYWCIMLLLLRYIPRTARRSEWTNNCRIAPIDPQRREPRAQSRGVLAPTSNNPKQNRLSLLISWSRSSCTGSRSAYLCI